MFVFYFVRSVVFYFLCIVSPFVYSYLIHVRVQVYRPLPPGGNLIPVNNYHIIILKWIFKKWDGGNDWIDLAQVLGSCIWGNGSSGSIQCEEFLD